MNDDRSLPVTGWAAEQGIDFLGPTAAQAAPSFSSTHDLTPQTVKDYRSFLHQSLDILAMELWCLIMSDRIMSDMLSSMDLEIPRVTAVLPEWDLGVVLVRGLV